MVKEISEEKRIQLIVEIECGNADVQCTHFVCLKNCKLS